MRIRIRNPGKENLIISEGGGRETRYLEYGGHLGVEVSQWGAPGQVGHHQAQQVRPAHQLHRVVAQQVGAAQSGHCYIARSVCCS